MCESYSYGLSFPPNHTNCSNSHCGNSHSQLPRSTSAPNSIMAHGRPVEYTSEHVEKARKYLSECVDQIEEYHKTRGEKSDTYERLVRVKLPTIEGLAAYLKVARSTLYLWEETYPDFSDILEELRVNQADRLLNEGMSGTYNSTIAKVLLTKHGYREGIDQSTNGKDLPTPILGGTTKPAE